LAALSLSSINANVPLCVVTVELDKTLGVRYYALVALVALPENVVAVIVPPYIVTPVSCLRVEVAPLVTPTRYSELDVSAVVVTEDAVPVRLPVTLPVKSPIIPLVKRPAPFTTRLPAVRSVAVKASKVPKSILLDAPPLATV